MSRSWFWSSRSSTASSKSHADVMRLVDQTVYDRGGGFSMTDRRSLLAGILFGGLVAGTIDIGAASLISWLNPIFILHVVAAGLLGPSASLSGGIPTALLGTLLQWAMSLI